MKMRSMSSMGSASSVRKRVRTSATTSGGSSITRANRYPRGYIPERRLVVRHPGDVDRHEWDERYAAAEGLVWSADANRFLVQEADDLRPGRALDVACGEGRNAIWLAERGWDVTGVDFSRVGLERAAALAAERRVSVEWILEDVVEYRPPPRFFDLVAILYLHLPEHQRKTVFGRAADAVAAGGTLLVVGHDLANLVDGHGGPQDPSVLCGPDDIADLLGDLAIVKAERVERRVATSDGERTAIDNLVRASRRDH